jgi:hypothetical protein
MFKYIAAKCNLGSFTIRLQYMQNPKPQDIWFLLLISAIKAHLRLGDNTIISAS